MTMRVSLVLVVGLGTATAAHADDKALDSGSVIYQRGSILYRSSARGAGEVELAPLNGKGTVRAMSTDPKGATLLVDVDGKWSWMPLDGSKKTLTSLACATGPATLDVDGRCVICRDPTAADRSIIINLATGKQVRTPASPLSARLAGTGTSRRLVWADATAIWSAPPGNLRRRSKVAPEAPERYFVPSWDGKRAVGVYNDYEYEGGAGRGRKKEAGVDVLMGFDLDGQAARRKGIRRGIPLDWSFDNEYVLVQEGIAACLMRASGGQYKCWKGYVAVSMAPDASYALVLGHRDGSRITGTPEPKVRTRGRSKPKTPPPAPLDDLPIEIPTGELALYRAKLDGPYDTKPILVTKVVDGAAVWIPGN